MRLLYVTRLFSGLAEGLHAGCWQPKGVPAVYRMVEALDSGPHEPTFVLACKDSHWNAQEDRTFQVSGLHAPITVLAGEPRFHRWPAGLRRRLSAMRQLVRIVRLVRDLRPDAIYFDRVHIWPAALLARFGNIPVVWRIMGVLESMHAVLADNGLRARALRWAYASPFALVLCTRDGSGGAHWMDAALDSNVPRELALNGVDLLGIAGAETTSISFTAPTKVLFVGRLESNKGCEEFLEAFLRAHAVVGTDIQAVIVGDGSLRDVLEKRVRQAGAMHAVSFTGLVTHEEVITFHRMSHIYVSLNSMGNLSNANLEALAYGACMILPAAEPRSGIDRETDELIPANAAIRISNRNNIEELARALLALHRDPAGRKALAHRAQKVAERRLWSWEQRVAHELGLLEGLVAPRH